MCISTQLDDAVHTKMTMYTYCIHTHTHTHTRARTQTLYRLLGRRTVLLSWNAQRREICLEFVFEGRVAVSDIWGEVVPDVNTKIKERAKAIHEFCD